MTSVSLISRISTPTLAGATHQRTNNRRHVQSHQRPGSFVKRLRKLQKQVRQANIKPASIMGCRYTKLDYVNMKTSGDGNSFTDTEDSNDRSGAPPITSLFSKDSLNSHSGRPMNFIGSPTIPPSQRGRYPMLNYQYSCASSDVMSIYTSGSDVGSMPDWANGSDLDADDLFDHLNLANAYADVVLARAQEDYIMEEELRLLRQHQERSMSPVPYIYQERICI